MKRFAMMIGVCTAMFCSGLYASAFYTEKYFNAGKLNSTYTYTGSIKGASVASVSLPEKHIHQFTVANSGTVTVGFRGGDGAGSGPQGTGMIVSIVRKNSSSSSMVTSLYRQMGASMGYVSFQATAGVNYTAEVRIGSSGSSMTYEVYTLKLTPTVKPSATSYTVRYNKNDGSGTTKTQSHTVGQAKQLLWLGSGLGWTRSGYEFLGWAKSSGGSVAYANGASVKNLTTTSGGTVNLYAKWRWAAGLKTRSVGASTPVVQPTAYGGTVADGGDYYIEITDEANAVCRVTVGSGAKAVSGDYAYQAVPGGLVITVGERLLLVSDDAEDGTGEWLP